MPHYGRVITFGADELSASMERSRNGFLLFGLGDVVAGGVSTLVGLAGKTKLFGVFIPSEFITRNGLVSEFTGAGFGTVRIGVGSSNGETVPTTKAMSVACTVYCEKGVTLGGGDQNLPRSAAGDFVSVAILGFRFKGRYEIVQKAGCFMYTRLVSVSALPRTGREPGSRCFLNISGV